MGGGGTSETLGKMRAPSWGTVGTEVAWGLYGFNAGCKLQNRFVRFEPGVYSNITGRVFNLHLDLFKGLGLVGEPKIRSSELDNCIALVNKRTTSLATGQSAQRRSRLHLFPSPDLGLGRSVPTAAWALEKRNEQNS